jgi:hypothetical protein
MYGSTDRFKSGKPNGGTASRIVSKQYLSFYPTFLVNQNSKPMNVAPLSLRCKGNRINPYNVPIEAFGKQTDTLRQIAQHVQQLEKKELWDPITSPNECRHYLIPPLWNIVHQYLEPRLVQKLVEKKHHTPYIATWWSDGERGKRIHTEWKFTIEVKWDNTDFNFERYYFACMYQTSSVYGKNTVQYICWDDDHLRCGPTVRIFLRNGQGSYLAEAEVRDTSLQIRVGKTCRLELRTTSCPRFDRTGKIYGDLHDLDPIIDQMVRFVKERDPKLAKEQDPKIRTAT